jgi:hypothetical protein
MPMQEGARFYTYEQTSTLGVVEAWELELLRRSVAMLPEGHSAGAVSKEQARQLLEEVATAKAETDRYCQAVAELRRMLHTLNAGWRPTIKMIWGPARSRQHRRIWAIPRYVAVSGPGISGRD